MVIDPAIGVDFGDTNLHAALARIPETDGLGPAIAFREALEPNAA